MRKFILILLSVAGLCVGVGSLAQDTNRVETNQVSSGVAGTNAAEGPSDAELQAAARQVWHKLIVFWTLGLLGAVVVAGFALYGAYRKFGVAGAIVVALLSRSEFSRWVDGFYFLVADVRAPIARLHSEPCESKSAIQRDTADCRRYLLV